MKNQLKAKVMQSARNVREQLRLTQPAMATLLGVTAQSVFRYENVSLPDTKILYKYRELALKYDFMEDSEVFAEALVEVTGIPRDRLPFEPGGKGVDEIIATLKNPVVNRDTLPDHSKPFVFPETKEEIEAITCVLEMMRANDREMWPMVQRAVKIWRMDHPHDEKEASQSDGDKRKTARGRRSA